MNDTTLKCIGRAHNAGQVVESFRQAREAGFNNINADLILGLPGESLEQLIYTLKEIKRLEPENVTVHTMAIKRASLYNEDFRNTAIADDEHVSSMMEYTKSFLRECIRIIYTGRSICFRILKTSAFPRRVLSAYIICRLWRRSRQ